MAHRCLIQVSGEAPWGLRAQAFAVAGAADFAVWQTEAAAVYRRHAAEAKKARTQAWQAWVGESLRQRPGKVFEWCRRTGEGPVGHVGSRAEACVDPAGVAVAVQRHWEGWWCAPALAGEGGAAPDLPPP